MRNSVFIFLILILLACESPLARQDNRQIIAKNELRRKLPPDAKDFDITGFREDTLMVWKDTLIKRPIQYDLDFEYTDPAGWKKKTAHVIFTPDGRSVLGLEIMERK